MNNNTSKIDPNQIHVTAESYRDLAGNTEMVPNINRALTDEEQKFLSKLLTHACEMADMADLFKRHLVYGDELSSELLNEKADQISIVEGSDEQPHITPPETLTPDVFRVIHALLGKLSEPGETIESFDTEDWDLKQVDRTNVIEEVGDAWWHDMILARIFDFRPVEVMGTNIRKLATRYGEKFTQDAAIHRDLDSERSTLEASSPTTDMTPEQQAFDKKVLDRLDHFAQSDLAEVIGNNGQGNLGMWRILAGPSEIESLRRLSFGRDSLEEAEEEPELQTLRPAWSPPVHLFFHDIPVVEVSHSCLWLMADSELRP